jgi:hypothetical protein
MLPDTSDVDAAVVTLLQNDATLKTLSPDGVYFDEAPPHTKQFVIVSLATGTDEDQYGGPQQRRAYQDLLYLVKAVELTTVPVKNIKAAAARIDALLEDATLTATGYGAITAHRVNPVRTLEVDQIDDTIRWQHRGGNYRVTATPTPQGKGAAA